MPFSLTFWESNGYFLQARKNGLHVDQRKVEKTVSRYNGYKSVFTNPWMLRQKNRSSIKGLGKYEQKEWTHSLFAVPIVRNHLPVVELTPRSKYTSSGFMSRHEWRVDKSAAKTRTNQNVC